MIWTDIEVCGRKAAFCDFNGRRLYVCEKAGVVEAWDGTRTAGIYGSIYEAKRAAEGRPLPKIKSSATPRGPLKYTVPVKRAVPVRPRIDAREELLKRYPVADLSVPVEVAPVIEFKARDLNVGRLFVNSIELAAPGICACGTRLGRRGKCPALCEMSCA